MSLVDDYRPHKLSEIIAQPKALDMFRRLLAIPGYSGGNYMVIGQAGTGKTSLGYALAGELGVSPTGVDFFEIDGTDLDMGGVERIREALRYVPMSGWRVIVLNEIHNVTKKACQACLSLFDRTYHRTIVLATTTREPSVQQSLYGGKDADSAFMSRWVQVPWTIQGLSAPFGAWCMELATRHGCNGQGVAYWVTKVTKARNNLRAVIQEIESLRTL